MYLKILKTDDRIISVENGTITTIEDFWKIPEIAEPSNIRIPKERLMLAKTKEELDNLTPYTRFYLQDSEDNDIIYKFTITVSRTWVWIDIGIFDGGKYLCGKAIGKPFFIVFDLPEEKKNLKIMIEVCRKHP